MITQIILYALALCKKNEEIFMGRKEKTISSLIKLRTAVHEQEHDKKTPGNRMGSGGFDR